MDKQQWKKISRIFDIALTLPQNRRTTYINHLCEDDYELQKEINELLAAVEDSDQLLEDHLKKNEILLNDLTAHLEKGSEMRSLAGSNIGRWKVVELLGRGGMGDVYKVERLESDIHQVGALKILRRGLDTPENIKRFRLEKQILAGLHHPNIASLIDGGVSDAGLPFLVMEYVEGTPIISYCNQNKLSIKKRLALFNKVCEGVQSAHKNLIVHRDLKPENILVTKEGQVKILDFGIAKLIDPDLYEFSAVETRKESRIMSLEYAAPEQVSGEVVTTSTDQYTLGTLLYELLAGIHPFDFKDKKYLTIQEIIKENNPSPPSKQLGDITNHKKFSKISKARSVQPTQLIRILKGDLDTIILKTLRKKPEERYNSVDQLKIDITNYLQNRPVIARADSRKYHIKKYFKRHSTGVAATAFFLIVVVSLVSYYTLQLTQERNTARVEAETAEQVSSFLISLFEASQPEHAQGDTITARTLLERGIERAELLNKQPMVQARMYEEIGRAYQTLGQYNESLPILEKAVTLQKNIYGEEHPEVANTINLQGLVLKELGEHAVAESLYNQALTIQHKTIGQQDPEIAGTLNNLGVLHRILGEYEEAESYLNKALSMQRNLHGNEHPQVIETLNNLGLVYRFQGKAEEAESTLREALNSHKRLTGDNHPMVATILDNLAYVLKEEKRYEEAEPIYREALRIRRNLFGNNHPDVAQTLNNLSVLLVKKGELDKAEKLIQEATDIRRRQFGTNHIEYVASLHNLAFFYQKNENYAPADSIYQLTLAKWKDLLGPEHPNVAVTLNNLASVQKAQNQHQEAEQNYLQALTLRQAAHGKNHPSVKRSIQRLIEFYDDWDKSTIASAYRDSLAMLK